jgi:hypothetical protein
LEFAYDPAENLTARTNNALVPAFSVNAVDELTGVINPITTRSY